MTDRSWLVAGISLPVIMPPVEKGSTLYVDSVWIKDANLTEAVRRGADEIWLVLCVGNSPAYPRREGLRGSGRAWWNEPCLSG